MTTLFRADRPTIASALPTLSARGHPDEQHHPKLAAPFALILTLTLQNVALAQAHLVPDTAFWSLRTTYIAAGCVVSGGSLFYARLSGSPIRLSNRRMLALSFVAGVGGLVAFWAAQAAFGSDQAGAIAALCGAWGGGEAAFRQGNNSAAPGWESPKEPKTDDDKEVKP